MPVASANQPDAMHETCDGHETPVNCTAAAPSGSAGGASDQRLPSQRSASATAAPRRSVCCPTATQSAGEGHDTPERNAAGDPVSGGVGWTVQRAPLKRSTTADPDVPAALPA